MATPKEIAAALNGPGHTVTVAEVEAWVSDGWRATPQAIIDANALGIPIDLVDSPEDPDVQPADCAWQWVEGDDSVLYRVPIQVFRKTRAIQQELNEAKRAAATALREHRAELADALGTPGPDVTPQQPGVDSPPI